jgi:hypothetical protein
VLVGKIAVLSLLNLAARNRKPCDWSHLLGSAATISRLLSPQWEGKEEGLFLLLFSPPHKSWDIGYQPLTRTMPIANVAIQ